MANLLGGAIGTGLLSAGLSKLLGPAAGTAASTGINSLVSALNNYAKTVGGSATTGANNPLDSSTKSPATVTRPQIDTSTPYVEYPTWEEALARAKARFEPQRESALLDNSKLDRDQSKRLIQALSAKGYSSARGGQRLTGEYDLTQDQSIRRDKLKNDYDSLINAYAGQLYSGETNKAAQELSAKLANRNSLNQTLLQQYGLDLTKDQNDTNKYNNYYNNFYKMMLAAMGLDVGEAN